MSPSSAPSARPGPALEVRPVGADDLDDLLPLLRRFPTSRMSREDWLYTLFAYPWSDLPKRGHALYADGRAVGFLGTVLARRTIAGRPESTCNPSSWIVLPEYRYAAMLLLRPLLRMGDTTMLYLTPSPEAHRMFVKQGALPLEEEQVVLQPFAGPVQTFRSLGGTFTVSPEALRAELEGEERQLYADHASSPVARHVLLRRGPRRCYVVAVPGRKRGLPYAEVLYLGDRAFFWEYHALARWALARAMGPAGLTVAVDSRFLVGRAPPLSLRWPMRRLYRPTRQEITPERIDGLYSELVGLRF